MFKSGDLVKIPHHSYWRRVFIIHHIETDGSVDLRDIQTGSGVGLGCFDRLERATVNDVLDYAKLNMEKRRKA